VHLRPPDKQLRYGADAGFEMNILNYESSGVPSSSQFTTDAEPFGSKASAQAFDI
jgi:hypothetical protein